MTISNLNTTYLYGGYQQDLYRMVKQRENDPLFQNGVGGGIHDDSVGLPTIGYGFNLTATAHTAAVITSAITYALTGSPNGTLSGDQQAGLNVVLAWKNQTPITVGGQSVILTNQQLIDLANPSTVKKPV